MENTPQARLRQDYEEGVNAAKGEGITPEETVNSLADDRSSIEQPKVETAAESVKLDEGAPDEGRTAGGEADTPPVLKGQGSRRARNELKALEVAESKMHQVGDHFNKHGRAMGYESKKAYDAAAREFATMHQGNPGALMFEGIWNGPGKLNGTAQRAISYDGKTVILDKTTGQIIDFYEGCDLKGWVNIIKLR